MGSADPVASQTAVGICHYRCEELFHEFDHTLVKQVDFEFFDQPVVRHQVEEGFQVQANAERILFFSDAVHFGNRVSNLALFLVCLTIRAFFSSKTTLNI